MKDLTYWLRKTPQPKVILADDRRIEVSNNARAWKDLTQTIKSLDPSKLTCLDGAGTVLRSITLEDDEKSPAASPEMTDLQLFAKLLSGAYEKGMTATQPMLNSAMEFVERQGVQLAKAEAEIERLRSHIYKQQLQLAELIGSPPAGEDDSIVGAMLAGALQGQAQLQTVGVTPLKQGAKK